MTRRPPRSTLFPSRRSSDLVCLEQHVLADRGGLQPGKLDRRGEVAERSEEHTSELQSRRDLVCRLLLEKKNADETSADYGGTNLTENSSSQVIALALPQPSS